MHGRTLALAGGLAAAAVLAAHAQSAAEWQDVIRHLRHPDARERLAAVERLGRANYRPAAEPVAALLVDPEDEVQAAAIDTELSFYLAEPVGGFRIFGIGESKSRAQLAFEAGPLARVADPAPDAVLDRLIEAIRDENGRIRFDAVHALGFIAEAPLGEARAIRLAAELDHYDPIIRAATARVLGHLGAAAATGALVVALDDTSDVVRQFAFEALGRLRAPAVRPPALAVTADGNGDVADAAFQALGRLAIAEDVDLFRAKLADRRVFTRRVAAESLGRAGDRDSIPGLQRMAETETSDEARLAAVFALQLMGQDRAATLAAGIGIDDGSQAEAYLLETGPAVLAGVESALGTVTGSRPLARLARIVGRLGSAEDVPLVEPLLASGDARVVAAATVAIEQLRSRP